MENKNYSFIPGRLVYKGSPEVEPDMAVDRENVKEGEGCNDHSLEPGDAATAKALRDEADIVAVNLTGATSAAVLREFADDYSDPEIEAKKSTKEVLAYAKSIGKELGVSIDWNSGNVSNFIYMNKATRLQDVVARTATLMQALKDLGQALDLAEPRVYSGTKLIDKLRFYGLSLSYPGGSQSGDDSKVRVGLRGGLGNIFRRMIREVVRLEAKAIRKQ